MRCRCGEGRLENTGRSAVNKQTWIRREEEDLVGKSDRRREKDNPDRSG